jgi:hypothetical protein
VFRTGLLRRDGSSSFSRLMSEIDRIRPSEFDHEERKFYGEIDDIIYRARDFSENTSFDAMMEDTPANYNHMNARKTPEKRAMPQRNKSELPLGLPAAEAIPQSS